MDSINLLVSLDLNYLPQLQVLLTSIRLNCPGERFQIFLLHSGLPEYVLDSLSRWCADVSYGFTAIQAGEALFQNAPVSKRYPREMYYRLLAPQLLPPGTDRTLYLDPDILVINPLRPLWETELEGNLFAAAAHTGKTELANNVNRIRLGVNHNYYNSGVLLMDLALGREQILPDTLFDFVEEHAAELVLPDQDLLNAVYGDEILPLDDAIWNYDARNYNNYLLRSSGICNTEWVMANTSILHFCGKAKPWKPNYIYRFGVLYQHYAQLARKDWNDRMRCKRLNVE